MKASRLARIREARIQDPQQLALNVGLKGPWYHDLESDGSRLVDGIAISSLRKLARELDVSPSALLSGRAEVVATPKNFIERLESHLLATHTTAEAFSKTVGWNIRALIADPRKVGELNGETLRAICERLGLDWLVVLDEMQV
jgi:transcriptional regulator with XRE-family HTH domain